MNTFSITRSIEIDMGHRIFSTDSKCRFVHGHRVKVEAVVNGLPREKGYSTGMVLDFGFLKREMVKYIDGPCDHGLVLAVNDPLVPVLLKDLKPFRDHIQKLVLDGGSYLFDKDGDAYCGKLYLIPYVPTSENLAKHWFELLKLPVQLCSEGCAELSKIVVWETPNCRASYPIG